MQRLVMGFVALGLAVLPVRAEEKPARVPATFDELKQKFDDAQKTWTEDRLALSRKIGAATTDEEKKELQKKFTELLAESPAKKYASLFLEYAQKNPKDPAAFDAISLALRYSGGPTAKDGAFPKVIAHLQATCISEPGVKKVLRTLAMSGNEAANKVVRDVMARNLDRKVQGAACKALLAAQENATVLAERLKNEAFRAQVEKTRGKEYVDKAIAAGEKAKKETEELKNTFREKYADLFPDLTVGRAAPEVISRGLDGKETKLSALKGKVVVLDIWATWCPPCRAMIPHEREMVDRLKDKPFALISISADEKKKTLTDFLEKEKMPWTHWWNGNEGGILEDWEVKFFPTIYVLDAKGVIRFTNIRGEKLEEAVNKLIEEAEGKK